MNGEPVIDARTQKDIIDQAQSLRPVYTPEWNTGREDSGTALVAIFSRLMEIMISRLNRVPEKNFLAFLDTAGVSLLPPKAARAPVKFVPSAGAKKDAVVPAGTQLATAPLPGQEPIPFETERSLTVSRSRLVQLFAYDPDADQYSNLQALVLLNDANESASFQPFFGSSLIPHRLYLSHDTVFQIGQPTTLTVIFTFASLTDPVRRLFQDGLQWAVRSGENDVRPLSPLSTVDLASRKITVVFDDPSLTSIATTKVDGLDGHWIQAEPRAALSRTLAGTKLQIAVGAEADGIKPVMAFANASALDVAGPYHPFGERPKIFDTFFIAVPEALNKGGSAVTLDFGYRKGSAGTFGVELTYEFWNGTEWTRLGVSRNTSTSADSTLPYAFVDNTLAFTEDPDVAGSDTSIRFTCPAIRPVEVNGKKNHWLRIRITAGDYGKDAEMKLTTEGEAKAPEDRRLSDWTFAPPSFKPPLISSLTASYDYTTPQRPTAVRTENNFVMASPDPLGEIQPFDAAQETQPACYLGFDSPFSPQPVSLYVAVEESVLTDDQRVIWEYWDGARWKNLGVQDGTTNFTESGIVEFIGPPDVSNGLFFGRNVNWLRARLETGDRTTPRLLGVYLNTVWARNAITLTSELLGSSTETPDASFTLSRFPVLDGLQIEVREPERPSDEDLAILQAEEGDDVVAPVQEGEGAIREVWVRWHRVDHFRFSSKRSRHYIANWFNGVVQFGSAARGMAPPAGRGNIRARWYQAGGGASGNVAKNTITVLKRAIPFVDKAFNVDAAGGGSDGETVEHVKERGPQTIKNRSRAVTWEDYEWLAREASFQVARARSLPARSKEDAGTIRLVLVPQSDAMKPYPSQGLIRQVKDYLSSRARSISTATLVISGPKYVDISIAANVIPERIEEADLVRRRVKDALTEFFHPLRGGPDGNGWGFGRDVFVSEVSKVIEDTEGVHHAEDVEICSSFYEDGRAALSMPGDDDDLTRLLYEVDIGDDYLVASGNHLIAVNGVGEPNLTPIFLGNTKSKELHNLRHEQTNCRLRSISAARTRRFHCLGTPVREGYDLCAWCFGHDVSQR